MKECNFCFSTIDFLKDKRGKWYPVELDGTDHRKICTGMPKKEKKVKLCGHGRNSRWCVTCRYKRGSYAL